MVPRLSVFSAVLPVLMLSSTVRAAELQLAKSYVGSDFESGFDFYTKDDPTHGFVNYVSLAAAKTMKLVSSTATSFKMAVDSSTAVATGRGRNSVRIVSKDEFADGVYVLDVSHMPVGCGTWPAFWTTVLDGWPTGGEIDIIEGSNALPPTDSVSYQNTFTSSPNLTGITLATTDVASLHTIPQCNIDPNQLGIQSGVQESFLCDATTRENIGCGVKLGNGTWGNDWNAGGGGLYVMWRDFANSGKVYVYTFPRSSTNVPPELLTTSNPLTTIDPSRWTVTPNANFTIPYCPSNTLLNHAIVFNIALCGDLAANTFAGSGCATSTQRTCEAFVRGTPGAFRDAYWDVNALRVYTATGMPATNKVVGLKTWQYVVIAVGAVAVAGLVIVLACCLLIRKRRRAAQANGEIPFTSRPQSSLPHLQSDFPPRISTMYGSSSKDVSSASSFEDGNAAILTATQSQRRGSGKPGSTYSAHTGGNNSNRRPSAPFTENADGSNVLRRGSVTTAVDSPSQATHRRGSVPFALDTPTTRPVSDAPVYYDLDHSPAPSLNNGSGRAATKKASSSRMSRKGGSSNSASNNGGTPPSSRPSSGFFSGPTDRAPVLRNGRAPSATPAPLKIGDGGTVWRDPHTPMPGETPAVGSMAAYNSAGLSGGSRRGSASVATVNGRRGSAAGASPLGVGTGHAQQRRGSQSSAGSGGGGGNGGSRKGSMVSQKPVINFGGGERRSSMSSNGGGRRSSTTKRRVSFGEEADRGDDAWEDTTGPGRGGDDGWGEEEYEIRR